MPSYLAQIIQKTLCSLLVFSALSLQATSGSPSWSPALTIDSNSLIQTAYVPTCYDSTNNRIFAAFVQPAEDSSAQPLFSIYSNGSWSSPGIIGGDSSTALADVFLCYDSEHDQVFATWADYYELYPMYSIYSGGVNGSWSTAAPITEDFTVVNDVTLCYGDGQVMAAWASADNYAYPTAAVYDNVAQDWTSVIAIDSSRPAFANVFLSYNEAASEFMAGWGNSGNNYPYYSTSSDGSEWSDSQLIGLGHFYIYQDVFLSYDSTDQQVFATWAFNEGENYPTYAIYSGTTWDEAMQIDTFSRVKSDLCSCYNSTTDQIFVACADLAQGTNTAYSIYSGTAWSTSPGVLLGLIDASYTDEAINVYLTFASKNNAVFATWSGTTGYPMYSIYSSPSSPAPIEPPHPFFRQITPNHPGHPLFQQ